jgi:hypothetical protein
VKQVVRFTKPYIIYTASESTDAEGCAVKSYSGAPRTVNIAVQPKNVSRLQLPVGDVNKDTLIGFAELDANVSVNDGVCVYEAEPDYMIESMQLWRTHRTFELVRIQ